MHAHVANGSVDMQHLILSPLALVDNHHVCAAIEISQGIGNARDFLAERVMQRKEVMDLGVERWLGGVAVIGGRNWWKGSGGQPEVRGRCMRVGVVGIQGIRDRERRVIAIGGIQVVCDVGEAVFEYAHLPGKRLHAGFIPLDASLLLAEVRRHGGHGTCGFMGKDLGALGLELAPHDCALA